MDYDTKANNPWDRRGAIALLITALLCSAPLAADAQATPATPPPAGTPAPVTPPPATPPTTAPVAPAPAVQPAPPDVVAPPAQLEPAVPTEEPGLGEEMAPVEEQAPKPPVSIGAWARLTNKLHSYTEPKKLDHLSQDAEVNLFFSAPITDQIGLAADLVGTYGPTPGGGDIQGTIAILDLIGKFDIADPFHIWVGRMLVPSDRANFSGSWFASPWNYPGFFVPFEAPTGPRQGPFGRNDGVTVWGQFQEGLFKYYLSAFDLHETAGTALFSGRLNLALINPEPGYYHNSTYYGEKDILAIGIGGQYEKDGWGADDYSEFNADVLFEKNFDGAGTLSLEGAFYNYMGDGRALNYTYFALASYLTPEKVGFGKIQPLVRVQQAKPEASGLDTWTLVDVQLGYVIEGFAARLALGFQHSDAPVTTDATMPGAFVTVPGNTLYLGTQLQI